MLCSKHFEDEDFEPAAEFRKTRRLKRNSAPTIFDYPKHLQPKKIKLRGPPRNRSVIIQSENEVKETKSDQILQNCLQDHDYCLPEANELKRRLEQVQSANETLQKKLINEQKKSSSESKRNLTLTETIEQLKNENVLEPENCERLEHLLTPTLQQLFERLRHQQGNPSTKKYPPELRVFALTLLFYSSKAYQFVRETFCKALPDITTVRKWFSNIEGSPGFCDQAFHLLAEKVQEGGLRNKTLFVSVMLDEMSLRKQIDYNLKTSSFKGYVNVGSGVSANEEVPATEALVIMAVGVNSFFKIPLGYFFIAGLILYSIKLKYQFPYTAIIYLGRFILILMGHNKFRKFNFY